MSRWHRFWLAAGLWLAASLPACAPAPPAATLPAATTQPSPAATATAPPPSPTAAAAPAWWQPPPGTTWQIQLDGQPVDRSYDVAVYDIDLFDTPAETIAALHREGRKVICYFSAGSFEDWRPDADAFPPEIIGYPLPNWPGEFYLDIRRRDLLAPIMTARMDLAVQKGCDAIDPDNVQNFLEDSGFPITPQDQLAYNRWLAAEAHARGLGVGLKNDLPQIPDLVDAFDFAVSEECFTYRECAPLRAFIAAGKAVFAIEYEAEPDDFCAQANAWRFSLVFKAWALNAPLQACPPAASP